MSLTLTAAELRELTGYSRASKQAGWLKANGFKFRVSRLGHPRVDRAHYLAKMGGSPAASVSEQTTPNWAALLTT